MKDIHINGYYITHYNPSVKVPLEPQDEIFLPCMDIIELVLPKCRHVMCSSNQLTELIIPMGCETVSCSNNNLTKLIVPKTCKYVNCTDNNLPKVIIDLFNSDNPIKIQLANNLQR
jgi:hypothetical protein